MTRCSCGADNPGDAKFCSSCGLEQTVATQCVCGAENSPNAKFCTNCGLKLVQREGQGHGGSIEDRPPKHGFIRWDNWVLWFLVGLVVIFLFFVCMGALGSTTQVSNPTADAPVRTIASPPTPTPASKCESEAVQTYFRQVERISGGIAKTLGVIGQLAADASVNPALIVDDSWHTDMTDSLDALDAYPESTEGGRRVSVLKRQEGVPVNLG